MKRSILALLLAAAMIATIFIGCSDAPAESPAEDAPSQESVSEETPAEPDETPDEPEEDGAEEDVVYQAAYAYFEDFPSDKNVIQTADLFPMLDAEEDLFLLDIRRPEDYAESHLRGAVNLSFFTTDISDNLNKIPDDRPVLVYCYTGQTASQVTALLNVAGKMAKNIQSGFNNGISQTDGFEDYLETTENALPEDTFDVDPAIQARLDEYFADKMAQDGTAYANYNLKPEDVKTIVDDMNDEYYILSIRAEEDYLEGHVPTASRIDYGLGMQEMLVNLPKDKKIVVYCYSGQTSSQTTAILRLLGYEAYSMSGGMGKADSESGWLGAGFETTTE